MKKRPPLRIFRAVVFALVLREVKGRFGRVRLGAVLGLLEPCLHILAFAVLFSLLRGGQANGIDYSVFLLISMTPFLMFRNVALQLMESIEANRALFSYRQIIPFDTFVARAVVECSLTAAVFVILFIGFYWVGYDIYIADPLEWLTVIGMGIAFSFGLGNIFAIATQAVPQTKVFIRLSFIPLYFASSVLFSPSHFPPEVLNYLMWNPFLHIVELIRHSAFENYTVVTGTSIQYVVLLTILVNFIGLGMYRLRRLDLKRI